MEKIGSIFSHLTFSSSYVRKLQLRSNEHIYGVYQTLFLIEPKERLRKRVVSILKRLPRVAR